MSVSLRKTSLFLRWVPMLRFALALSFYPWIAGATHAQSDTAVLCDRAATQASQTTGVPLQLLRALTRAETGRTRDGDLQPWPWSVNESGDGHWFDGKSDAVDYVRAALDRGVANIDIGCFQLNYRWHGASFASVQAMFDPNENAHYAARFLRDLYAETGDWRLAAGAFHSREADQAAPYLERLEWVLAETSGTAEEATSGAFPANTYPLLAEGRAKGLRGSLVPETGILVALIPAGQAAQSILER